MAHEWDEYIQSSVFAIYDACDKNLADEVVANTATINRSVDEIAAVSQQSAAGIEETSATVEQVTGSMDEISSSAATLAQMAESLNDNVRQFKLYND